MILGNIQHVVCAIKKRMDKGCNSKGYGSLRPANKRHACSNKRYPIEKKYATFDLNHRIKAGVRSRVLTGAKPRFLMAWMPK